MDATRALKKVKHQKNTKQHVKLICEKYPVNAKDLCDIYKMLDQRRRRCAAVVEMLLFVRL